MEEIDRIKIRRILKKRRVSYDTFSYLCDISLRKVSVEEIAEKISASRQAVLGALRGLGTRYREEDSLEHFGLVAHEKKAINNNTIFVYGITPVGLREKELVRNHGEIKYTTNSEYKINVTVVESR